jgi:hypothetical protein
VRGFGGKYLLGVGPDHPDDRKYFRPILALKGAMAVVRLLQSARQKKCPKLLKVIRVNISRRCCDLKSYKKAGNFPALVFMKKLPLIKPVINFIFNIYEILRAVKITPYPHIP